MEFSANFKFALKEVLGIEGGFVNDKNDKGGKTNFGITEAIAKKFGYSPEELTPEIAKEIYYKEFWKKYNLDLIQDKNIAKEIFEFGVNSGMKRAIKTLQRSYNALNIKNLLVEDGVLGPKTAATINNYKYKNSLLKMQNIIQGMFYLILAEGDKEALESFDNHQEVNGNPVNKHFIRGWINKRVELNQ